MSATLTDDLLIQLGTSGETPLFVRILALGAWRADETGAAGFDPGELPYLLRHPSELTQRGSTSVDRAIEKAHREGFVCADSTVDRLVMPSTRVRSARRWAVTG